MLNSVKIRIVSPAQILFTAWAGEPPTYAGTDKRNQGVLARLEGWETPTVAVTTTPSLLEPGSYVSQIVVPPKEIVVGGDFEFANNEEVKSFQRALSAAVYPVKNMEILREFYNSSGTVERTETIGGLLTAVSRWEETDEFVSADFTFLAARPLRRVKAGTAAETQII